MIDVPVLRAHVSCGVRVCTCVSCCNRSLSESTLLLQVRASSRVTKGGPCEIDPRPVDVGASWAVVALIALELTCTQPHDQPKAGCNSSSCPPVPRPRVVRAELEAECSRCSIASQTRRRSSGIHSCCTKLN